MAVAKMKLVNVIGRVDSLDPVIFACGKTGISQPDDTMSFFSDTSKFKSIQEDNPYAEPLSKLEAAINRIGGELKTVDTDVHANDDKQELFDYADTFSKRVTELTHDRGLLSVKIESLSKDSEQFEHFIGLDINLDDILSCQMIKVRFGRLPRDSYEKLEMYDDNPYVLFFPGTSDAQYYWGVYFVPLEYAAEVDRIFSGLYFERLRIPAAAGTPQSIVEKIRSDRQSAEEALRKTDGEIQSFWAKEHTQCLLVFSKLKQFHYYFSARQLAARYNDKFLLTGWIPAKEEKKFRIALDALDGIEYSVENDGGDTHHTPPIKLRNPGLFSPYEFYVGLYGLPRYNEIDPTIFVAITFTVVFGIMFGDLGQGLCLALIGALMWKKKKITLGKILIPCGLSGAFFGLVYGSVFGFESALNPLYKALFGLSNKPIEVMNPSMTPMVLLSAVGVGLLLIILAMILNVYSSMKRRDYVSGIFGPNGVAGLIFYCSLVFGCIAQVAGVFKMNLLYILCLIVLPITLVFLREPLGKRMGRDPNWRPEKWGSYISESFFEMFETLLSYFSNTISFLRVGAFVLVHAGMMMAVFTLADLTKGFCFNFFYLLIIVSGNALVLVMEAFLVSIQVLRLEFYEMFSRYYNGDGQPFKPLKPSSGDRVFSKV